jgi:4-alpha-glucanotransferase
MLEAARGGGAGIVAEDLGIVPPWVRASLTRLGLPGYRVLVWEKDDVAGKEVFRDPAAYPALSVACFGTHDTPPVAAWWESLGKEERAEVLEIPSLKKVAADLGATFTPAVHRALADALNGSASDLVLFLIQDLLGTKERINTPATVGPHNWSYRLPAPIEELRADPSVFKLTEMLRRSVEAAGR